MRYNSPCFDCPERIFQCHTECQRYRKFQKLNEAEKAKIKENKNFGKEAKAFTIQRTYKTKRDLER